VFFVKSSGGLTGVALAMVLAAACANRHPKTATVIEPPQALAVPPPPPRVILPPQPEAPEPVEEPQPASPTRPRPRNQGRPATTEPKTDAPKAEAPTQPTPPATPEAQPPEKPNQDLQPADAAGENAIRRQIGRARQDLNRVNYAGLSADMKAQYDQANRFLALSEQNLREHNLLFASTLADKAGAIAEMLTRR
jgi:outer membrane biosynthesis protein TonB